MQKEPNLVNDLKAVFSKLFRKKSPHFSPQPSSGKPMSFPPEFSPPEIIFQYLNFTIPELQPIKLSLELGKEKKAFEQFFKYLKMKRPSSFMVNYWNREEIVELLKTDYAETVPELLRTANDILQHKFVLFFSHNIQAESPMDWNTSYPYEGYYGEVKYWKPGKRYSKATLLAEERDDIYFVWQLNRHQHFIDLGKAYWYTGDDAYVRKFMAHVLSWIEQNPYPLSVNWIHPYEIALRGIFWLFGYAFFFSSDLIDAAFFCKFYQILLYHGHVLYDSLQTKSSDSALHEIVAQATCLYLLSTMFPEYLHSKAWNKLSWEVLQWNTPLLQVEMMLHSSPASLTTQLELYSLVLLVRQNNRFHIPQSMVNAIETLLQRWSLFLRPDGTLCGFGEDFPEYLLSGTVKRPETFQILLSMFVLLLKKNDRPICTLQFHQPLLWFFGCEGRQEFMQLTISSLENKQSNLIPDSSYAMMRSASAQEEGFCLFSTGLNAFRTPPSLKHTDLLSFELFANGQEYLIDGGPFSYQQTDEWNQYFRSAQAHNSITVDRITHVNFAERSIKSTFDHWVSTPAFDFVSGRHNGFEDIGEPITHRRSIFYYKPNYWILCDLLNGGGQHFFDQYFHFPPFRLNVDFANKRVDICTDEDRHFVLMPFNPNDMDVSIFTGGETPDSGWISRGYKFPVGASFIKYGKQTSAPTSFHTLLYAYHAAQSVSLSGRDLKTTCQGKFLLCHEISALEISCADETHYFIHLYLPRKQQLVEIEPDITFRGSLVFLRKHGQDVREIHLYQATYLTMRGVTLFTADAPIESISLYIEDDTLRVICSENYTFRIQRPDISTVLVNNRQIRLRREDDFLLISTTRI